MSTTDGGSVTTAGGHRGGDNPRPYTLALPKWVNSIFQGNLA